MPTRFAVATGNWNTGATWDNGAVPVAGDTIYPNGFTVTIDTDINVASLNNNISPVAIPNIATPAMTSNTQPSGTVISSNNSGTAYVCFNQDNSTSNFWSSGVASTGWIGYTFPSAKVIKRYIIKISSTSQGNPKTWTFEGSNDGFATAGVQLDQVLSYTTNANYTSVLLANITAYTSYRVNVTAVQGASTVLICELEMTESTTASPVYGTTTGGSFTVPASLSGTRNIVQSGAGIITNNVNNILTLAHTTGNTVNMNISGSGYIFNPNNQTSFGSFYVSQITGTGTTNFNGDIWGSQISGQYNTLGLIGITNSAIVNVFGNCYGAKINNTSYPVFNLNTGSNSAILNITGNLIGTDTTSGLLSYIVFNQTLATVNITGNLTSNLGYCYYSTSNGTLNIPSGIITVTNTNSVPAIFMTGLTSLLTLNSPIINKNNVNSIFAVKVRFYSTAQVEWTFQTNVGGTDRVLRNATGSLGLPSFTDVKIGQPYGPNNDIIGACVIPPANAVGVGIPVSTIVPINQPVPVTVGTSQLTGEDLLNAISTSSNVVAIRIKNVSTVETTGVQLAAFNRI